MLTAGQVEPGVKWMMDDGEFSEGVWKVSGPVKKMYLEMWISQHYFPIETTGFL